MIQDFISAFKQEYKLKGKSLLLHPFENQNIERITNAVKENNIVYPVTVMLDSRIREHDFLDLNHSYYRPFLDTLSNHDKIDESFENLFVLFYDKPNSKRKKILDHYLNLIGDEGFAFILTAGTEVLMRHYYDHLLQKFSIEMIVATAFAENRSAIDKTLFILKKKGEKKKAVDPTYLFRATKDLPSKASIKRNIKAFKNSEFMIMPLSTKAISSTLKSFFSLTGLITVWNFILYFFAKSKSLWSCAGQPKTAPNP